MQLTGALFLLPTLLLLASASPTDTPASPAVGTDVSPATGTVNMNLGADAYCGGYSAAGCSNACYHLGYRCYRCTSSYCVCSNSGC